MRILFAIGIAVSALLLTSCSNPDTSGGVTLSKDPHPENAPFPHGACNDDHGFGEMDTGCGWISFNERSHYISDANKFPHGSCEGPHKNPTTRDNGCGWIKGYYIKPSADLSYANLGYTDLSGANLTGANLTFTELDHTNLSGAMMHGVKVTSDTSCFYTICPNRTTVAECRNCWF